MSDWSVPNLQVLTCMGAQSERGLGPRIFAFPARALESREQQNNGTVPRFTVRQASQPVCNMPIHSFSVKLSHSNNENDRIQKSPNYEIDCLITMYKGRRCFSKILSKAATTSRKIWFCDYVHESPRVFYDTVVSTLSIMDQYPTTERANPHWQYFPTNFRGP